MAEDQEQSLDDRFYALENKLAEKEASMAFIASVSALLAGGVSGTRPISDCEKECLKITDIQARLNCMLKCIADGKAGSIIA